MTFLVKIILAKKKCFEYINFTVRPSSLSIPNKLGLACGSLVGN